MQIRLRHLVYLTYLVIGVFVAWDRGYVTLSWLKTLASALLAIFLWWLILLGVNLHVHLGQQSHLGSRAT